MPEIKRTKREKQKKKKNWTHPLELSHLPRQSSSSSSPGHPTPRCRRYSSSASAFGDDRRERETRGPVRRKYAYDTPPRRSTLAPSRRVARSPGLSPLLVASSPRSPFDFSAPSRRNAGPHDTGDAGGRARRGGHALLTVAALANSAHVRATFV